MRLFFVLVSAAYGSIAPRDPLKFVFDTVSEVIVDNIQEEAQLQIDEDRWIAELGVKAKACRDTKESQSASKSTALRELNQDAHYLISQASRKIEHYREQLIKLGQIQGAQNSSALGKEIAAKAAEATTLFRQRIDARSRMIHRVQAVKCSE